MLRRTFLKAVAVLPFVGLPSVGEAKPKSPQPDSLRYDVSYLWHPDLEAVLDYREKVEELLGPEVARELRIVVGRKNYGLIYDRNGSQERAAATAKHHSKILKAADLEAALEMRDEGYDYLYNVSYGLGSNLAQLKKDFATVSRAFGVEVGKNLFIEEAGESKYILVYHRYGRRESAGETAKKHAAILREHGLSAAITPEQNNSAVHDLRGMTNDEREERKPVQPAPSPPRPLPAPRPTGGNLERLVEEIVAGYRKRHKDAADERTAWCVYDFTTGQKLVSINEDVPMQCASMVKPLVALAYFHQVNAGKLHYGKEARRKMERMIQKSDNAATNWIIAQAGGEKRVDGIIEDYYRHILPQTDVRERIPAGGATYRNKASAHDYSRFLYALWHNQIPHAAEIRRLMALPGRDRIYSGVPEIPPGTEVYNKTGSTARLCGDMGILVADGKQRREHPYILVGIIEKASRTRNYGAWIHDRGNLIRRVSGAVYQDIMKRHS
ncbi:serine hydrolase [Candidatus Woesearchaeota archaeon]|nr:serine hydrolase [Candidatus Woesearchaeota archaeon]